MQDLVGDFGGDQEADQPVCCWDEVRHEGVSDGTTHTQLLDSPILTLILQCELNSHILNPAPKHESMISGIDSKPVLEIPQILFVLRIIK